MLGVRELMCALLNAPNVQIHAKVPNSVPHMIYLFHKKQHSKGKKKWVNLWSKGRTKKEKDLVTKR